MALLFELCLLHGKSACADQAVGWAAFPLCDNSFGIVEGKFKCPLLRGHYEQKLSSFREIEDLICLDLDHWLCNLYFQVCNMLLYLERFYIFFPKLISSLWLPFMKLKILASFTKKQKELYLGANF